MSFLDIQTQTAWGMIRLIRKEGFVVLLNLSEHMSIEAATLLAYQRGLQRLDRDSLVNYADTAESHQRWRKDQLEELFKITGLALVETTQKMGRGLVRFAKGVRT